MPCCKYFARVHSNKSFHRLQAAILWRLTVVCLHGYGRETLVHRCPACANWFSLFFLGLFFLMGHRRAELAPATKRFVGGEGAMDD